MVLTAYMTTTDWLIACRERFSRRTMVESSLQKRLSGRSCTFFGTSFKTNEKLYDGYADDGNYMVWRVNQPIYGMGMGTLLTVECGASGEIVKKFMMKPLPVGLDVFPHKNLIVLCVCFFLWLSGLRKTKSLATLFKSSCRKFHVPVKNIISKICKLATGERFGSRQNGGLHLHETSITFA